MADLVQHAAHLGCVGNLDGVADAPQPEPPPVVEKAPEPAPEPPTPPKSATDDNFYQDPLIQAALEVFEGKVVS